MVQINDVKNDARANRTSAHTHIRGLGLKSDGYAEKNSAGFVGQAAAREVSRRNFCAGARHSQTELDLRIKPGTLSVVGSSSAVQRCAYIRSELEQN